MLTPESTEFNKDAHVVVKVEEEVGEVVVL